MNSYNKRIEKCTTLDELFDVWKEAHVQEKCVCESDIKRGSFTTDGAISPENYFSANTKLLIVSRESHLKSGEKFEGQFWLKDVYEGNAKQLLFARRVTILASAVINDDFDKIDKNYKNLKNISFMNLNKRGGGKTCNKKDFEKYICKYHVAIKKEIEILNPDIIICAGKGLKVQLETIVGAENYKIVEAYHPSYWKISDEDYLKKLEKEINKI